MATRHLFSVTPLARFLKLATLAPLLMISPPVLAQLVIENGASKTIDGSTRVDDYLVTGASSLTANDAKTNQIVASGGSTIVLNGTQATATGNSNGIDLTTSSATIANKSEVVSSGTGLRLLEAGGVGSIARVNDSKITGGALGASLGANSELILEAGSSVTASNANGVGIRSFGGKISASDSTITGGLNGVLLTADRNLPAGNALILNNTNVVGLTGSAIVVNGQTQTNTESVNIEVNNGSTLTGGNGTLLEVINGSSVNFKADNSELVGDIIVEAGSSAAIVLDNFATLTGRLENVENLAINGNAKWVMVEDSEVENLVMDGGAIQFGNPGEFYKLTVGELAGNGTFFMHADFSTGQVDTLTVRGEATGNHLIAINSSGTEPVAPGAIPVVHIGSGNAQFSLLGGEVDLGAFSYNLIQQGSNDWVLNTASRVISPGTRSVMALSNAAPTAWYGELSTLRSRMGELRLDDGKAGFWMRAYGNKFDVGAASGVAYKQTQQGLSFGADAPLPAADGQWLVGLLVGYSQSDLDVSRGTTGKIDSYYVGAYTTWLDEPSGYYVDGVLKLNRFQNQSKVQLSDGNKTEGRFDNHAVGASLEAGRHIKLADDYFVEPYAQLSGVIIQRADYTLDNGLSAEGSRAHSLLGKVGATVGRNFILKEGQVVQPYLRAAYVHEFADNNKVEVNNNKFNTDLSGSRGELGAGLAMTLADKVSIHADVDYSNGKKIEQPWGVNLGVRYSW